MTDLSWIGFAAILALTLFAAALVSHSGLSPRLKLLVYSALILRIGGALVYHGLIEGYYGGGDFRLYFERGSAYAERMWQGDFSMYSNSAEWWNRWWGTQFVFFASGIVFALIGPSILGGFIFFALLSFVGLIGFGVAFHRAYPHVEPTRYLRWIWLFPSLWFWPAVIGKEALILLGLGLAVMAYVGRRGRISWVLLVLGGALIFAVRPQVAAVLLVSMLIGQWLSFGERWTLRKVVQGSLVVAACFAGLSYAGTYLWVGGFDAVGAGEYLEATASAADRGGSSLEGARIGWQGVPLALGNILLRPFPWEVRNVTQLLASVEVLTLWLILWVRRRSVARSLRDWRSDRFKSVAIPFVLLYAASLGMVVVNFGIIARQRVFLFPFLFIFLEAIPGPRRVTPDSAAPSREDAEPGPTRMHLPGDAIAGRVALRTASPRPHE